MTDWVATGTAPIGWSDLCARHASLFHSQTWMELLERSFGCKSIYVSNRDLDFGIGISAFRAGPFKLGYVGFPVGGIIGEEKLSTNTPGQLKSALAGQGLTAIRIPASAFTPADSLDLPCASTPETAIVDLQSWSMRKASENRRRDVRKSLRSDLTVVDAQDPDDGARLYDLYHGTIKRHRGSLRYTPAYFTGLIRLAQGRSDLRVLLAKREKSIAAFNIVAKHGSTGFYLHGAFDWEVRGLRPSALLMHEAIEWAKEGGCQSFNLMSSPPGQDSLIRFKEHWGAETRVHRTYTLPMRADYRVFHAAAVLSKLVYR